MRWITGPWRWVTDDGFNHWAGHSGALACLDLRTIPEMSQQGGTPGMGLFLMPAGSRLGSDYTVLGDGNWHDVKLNQREKDALRIGKRVPDGPDLVGVVWDMLTSGSDPDGLTAPKPLMPGVDRRIHLIVGKHYRQRFAFGRHPHTAKVRDMLQRKFAANWDGASKMSEFDHARRCLDFDVKKYGLDDWREIVPTRLRGELDGPLPHQTMITESFNTADSDTLGPDLSWSELESDVDVVSNEAACQATDNHSCRAESDLSSSDHYGQIDLAGSGTDDGGPAARFSASALTYYLTVGRDSLNQTQLYKRVSGSFSSLAGPGSVAVASGDTLQTECNGSTIRSLLNAVEQHSVTDVSITSNTRCGFYGYSATTFDNFEAADLGGGGGITYTQLERNIDRGLDRGQYTRIG